MTQTKGGGRVKTAVKTLMSMLQNITSHQYLLVQRTRLLRHASTQRRVIRKTRWNKWLTNDRTLIVRVSPALELTTRHINKIEGTTTRVGIMWRLHTDYGKSCTANGYGIHKLDGKVGRSKEESPRKKASTLQKLPKTVQW